MSNLVVVAYNDLATANQVREKLFELSREHLVDLEDAVVVERREDGKIKLHQAVSNPAVGAAGGALWGGVIGLLFLQPLLGAAVGAAAGAAGGALTDTGINDNFMRELSHNLRPGAAALFALFKTAAHDKVFPRIAEYGGHLVQTSLSTADEEALREALEATATARASAPAPGAAPESPQTTETPQAPGSPKTGGGAPTL
ncbi:DUF1269 domain-containing protein [Streptomyces sp. NPDC052051]|uniref:DUF1269 domain-containing protein n=1 Tax=Streptomyces sp. NPDC052051 TaxID=3154649 RepID=UPI003448B147